MNLFNLLKITMKGGDIYNYATEYSRAVWGMGNSVAGATLLSTVSISPCSVALSLNATTISLYAVTLSLISVATLLFAVSILLFAIAYLLLAVATITNPLREGAIILQ